MKVSSQLERAQLENTTSDAAAGTRGRVTWNTTSLKSMLDDGTNLRAMLRNDQLCILGNSGTASENIRFHRGAAGVLQLVSGADVTAEGTLVSSLQIISARQESFTTAGRPAAGNIGRIIFDTDLGSLFRDNGTVWTRESMTVTTKGDIQTFSTVPASLGVGADGTVLQADSAEATGMKWTTIAVPTPTGGGIPFFGTTAPSGWVLASGRTIGNATSGGTERANADTVDLFTLLWNSFANAQLPIQDSAGAASTRGVNAAADYAANKRMPLPDMRGRTAVGKDDMGGSAASRMTTGGSGVDGATLGASGGTQTHTLTEAQIPAHTHFMAANASSTSAVTSANYVAKTNSGGAATDYNFGGTATVASQGLTSTGTGGGTAHQNTQPSFVANFIIKL